jgi:K+-transporting ATPase A subunit
LAFAALGVPQTLSASAEATTLEGAKQIIALGPVASQETIKLIGDNGGGFFNANSAHPFENPKSGRISFKTGASSFCRSPWCLRSGAWSSTGVRDAPCWSRWRSFL